MTATVLLFKHTWEDEIYLGGARERIFVVLKARKNKPYTSREQALHTSTTVPPYLSPRSDLFVANRKTITPVKLSMQGARTCIEHNRQCSWSPSCLTATKWVWSPQVVLTAALRSSAPPTYVRKQETPHSPTEHGDTTYRVRPSPEHEH